MDSLTASAHWAVQLVHALPHYLEVLGSASPTMHWIMARGQWAVELLQCSASLRGENEHWNCYKALPQ